MKTSVKKSSRRSSSAKKAARGIQPSSGVVVSAKVFDSLIKAASRKRRPTPTLKAMVERYKKTFE